MPDWKNMVREKLGHLPLSNRRQDEIIQEIAQQLESAYEEALAKGATESEAERRSLAQFSDWEKLRREVFQSVEGTRLPVWEQRGIFSPSRLPVWIALALTLALLAVPAFRQALTILPALRDDRSFFNSRVFSKKSLARIEQSGDMQKYARALAFAALHSPDHLQAAHAAERAIALDPQLTWISAQVSHASNSMPGYDPHPWIERLKAWDPQNSFPYLLEASAYVSSGWESRWEKYSPLTSELESALVAEPAWRAPMERAFTAPRIDFYWERQFALDRQVLQEQGLDRPDILLYAALSGPIPDFRYIKFYADFQLNDVGASNEKLGRPNEALAAYWNVARFGELLGRESTSIGEMCSVQYRKRAYGRIIPILRKEGRLGEATAVQAALVALPDCLSGQFPSRRDDSGPRSARIVSISAIFLEVLGVGTGLWLISVLALRWRPNMSSALNRMASILSYAPPALLFAAFMLSVSYYPYAQTIGRFTSEKELMDVYEPFLFNIVDVANLGSFTGIWLTGMFWPFVWCVAVALAGGLLLKWVARRQRSDRQGAA